MCEGCNAPPPSVEKHNSNVLGSATLAPNPSSGLLQLKVPETKESDAQIKVYDSKGNLIHDYGKIKLTSENGGFVFDLQTLTSGYYFISVVTDNQYINLPFTLIK